MKDYVFFLILFCAIVTKCNCDTKFGSDFPNNFSLSDEHHRLETQLEAETQLGTDPRIAGGHPATFDGTKHVASLRLKSKDKKQFGAGHICEGSLIKSSYIVTAAHCLYNKDKNAMRDANEFVVVMGTLNRFTRTSNTLEYNVKRIHYHSKFNITTLQNDIATIIIDGEVPENHPYAEVIILASKLYPKEYTCRVDGWGGIHFDEYNPQPSNVLLTADIQIVDQALCETTNNKIEDGMICCAGSGEWLGGKELCQDDSSAQFSCDGILAGIGSRSDKCGNRPSIYTDVHVYRDWILKNSASSLFQLKIILIGIILTFSKVLLI